MKRFFWLSLLLFLFALPGCTKEEKPAVVGNPAPDFTLKDLGGRAVKFADLRGKVVVLNFWATWCPPCVREMPALDRFHREFSPRGWQVLGLAADKAEPVREFLARTPVGYPIGLAGFGGIELSRKLGNLSGGLPFTVLFDAAGRVAHRHSGETRFEQLAGWAQGIS